MENYEIRVNQKGQQINNFINFSTAGKYYKDVSKVTYVHIYPSERVKRSLKKFLILSYIVGGV
jgi:hypothetical protein